MTTSSRQILITLSRRDLLGLLEKLDQPESLRTIVSREFLIDEELAPDGLLVIVAEDDECHYDSRPAARSTSATERRFAVQTTDQLRSDVPPAAQMPTAVARRRHSAGRLHPWVFRQHQVWVDRHGVEHEIESMPLDYVRNVIGFCELDAWRMWWCVAGDDLLDALDYITSVSNDRPERAAALVPGVIAAFASEVETDPLAWLAATPLYIALKRRAGDDL